MTGARTGAALVHPAPAKGEIKIDALHELLAAAAPGDRHALSHAKLACCAGGGLEVKAYVTLGRDEATMGRLASIRQILARGAPATPAAE